MSALDTELQTLIDEARRLEAPPADGAASTWSAIAARSAEGLGPAVPVDLSGLPGAPAGSAATGGAGGGTAAGAGGSATLKLAVLVVLGGGAVVGGAAALGGDPPPPTVDRAFAAPVAVPVAQPAPANEDASSATPPEADPPTPDAEPSAAAEATPPSTGRRERGSKAPEQSPIREEARLLTEAWRALEAGRTRAALRRLSEHARRFPRGMLTQEREAARAVARCKLGRGGASKFLERYPKSAYAARVRAACDESTAP